MRTPITLLTAFVAVGIPTSMVLAQPAGAPPLGAGQNDVLFYTHSDPDVPDLVLVEADEPETQNTTWLGVEVVPVPPPLAAHLATGSGGLMIGNVFKGSPADKAGLDRNDVILEIGGKKVTGDVGEFMRTIKQFKPGDTLRMSYLHGGATKEISLQVAARPRRVEPKYPPEGYDFRGRILRRGPEGWIVDDLGPMPAPGELPKRLKLYADKLWSKPVPGANCESPEARRVTKEGEVLVVRRLPDGKIEVKRYMQENGEKSASTKTYADFKELETADRPAAGLLKDAEAGLMEMPAPPPADGLSPEWREWLGHLRESYQDEMRKYREAMKDYERHTEDYQNALREWRQRFGKYLHENRWDDRWDQWRDRFFQGPLEGMRPATSQPAAGPGACPQHASPTPTPKKPVIGIEKAPAPTQRPPVVPPAPGVRFETKPDGSITVFLRHQDAEMSRSYASEKAMQEQAPRLYQQYQGLQREFR